MTTILGVEFSAFNPDSDCTLLGRNLTQSTPEQTSEGDEQQLKRYVIIASESQSTVGYRAHIGLEGKVSVLADGHIVIVTTGLARIGEVLSGAQYKHLDSFSIDKLMKETEGKKVHYNELSRPEQARLVRKFITNYVSPAIKSALKSYESVREDKKTFPLSGRCLICMCGFVFDMDGQYYSARDEVPFRVLGSGGSYATGSLRRGLLYNKGASINVKYEATAAIQAAIDSDIYSGGPIHLYLMSEREGLISHDVYNNDLTLMSEAEAKEYGAVSHKVKLSYSDDNFDTNDNVIVLPTKEEIAMSTRSRTSNYLPSQLKTKYSK